MSSPIVKREPKLRDIIHEMQSVVSSLNMGVDTLPGAQESETGWISETLKWGKHAYEHCSAALEMLYTLHEAEYRREVTRE